MEPRNRFRSLKDLQIRPLERYLFTTRTFLLSKYLNSISLPSPLNPPKRCKWNKIFCASHVYKFILYLFYSKGFLSIPLSLLLFLVSSYSFPLSVSFSINTQYVPPLHSPSHTALSVDVHTVHCTYRKALKGPALPGA